MNLDNKELKSIIRRFRRIEINQARILEAARLISKMIATESTYNSLKSDQEFGRWYAAAGIAIVALGFSIGWSKPLEIPEDIMVFLLICIGFISSISGVVLVFNTRRKMSDFINSLSEMSKLGQSEREK